MRRPLWYAKKSYLWFCTKERESKKKALTPDKSCVISLANPLVESEGGERTRKKKTHCFGFFGLESTQKSLALVSKAKKVGRTRELAFLSHAQFFSGPVTTSSLPRCTQSFQYFSLSLFFRAVSSDFQSFVVYRP